MGTLAPDSITVIMVLSMAAIGNLPALLVGFRV